MSEAPEPPRRHRVGDTPGPGVTVVKSSPGGPGAPQVLIDEEKLRQFAALHLSYRHLGLIFGVSDAFMKEKYEAVIEEARAVNISRMLHAQFDEAINKRNEKLLIHLGKNYAGQTDKTAVDHSGGLQMVHRYQAQIPDNGRDDVMSPPPAVEDGDRRSDLAEEASYAVADFPPQDAPGDPDEEAR